MVRYFQSNANSATKFNLLIKNTPFCPFTMKVTYFDLQQVTICKFYTSIVGEKVNNRLPGNTIKVSFFKSTFNVFFSIYPRACCARLCKKQNPLPFKFCLSDLR